MELYTDEEYLQLVSTREFVYWNICNLKHRKWFQFNFRKNGVEKSLKILCKNGWKINRNIAFITLTFLIYNFQRDEW